MRLLVTPSFVRAAKRLYSSQKADFDGAVRTISSDPEIGEAKVGDLSGVRVYNLVSQISFACWPTASSTKTV